MYIPTYTLKFTMVIIAAIDSLFTHLSTVNYPLRTLLLTIKFKPILLYIPTYYLRPTYLPYLSTYSFIHIGTSTYLLNFQWRR